jgi:hypothetical protein
VGADILLKDDYVPEKKEVTEVDIEKQRKLDELHRLKNFKRDFLMWCRPTAINVYRDHTGEIDLLYSDPEILDYHREGCIKVGISEELGTEYIKFFVEIVDDEKWIQDLLNEMGLRLQHETQITENLDFMKKVWKELQEIHRKEEKERELYLQKVKERQEQSN